MQDLAKREAQLIEFGDAMLILSCLTTRRDGIAHMAQAVTRGGAGANSNGYAGGG